MPFWQEKDEQSVPGTHLATGHLAAVLRVDYANHPGAGSVDGPHDPWKREQGCAADWWRCDSWERGRDARFVWVALAPPSARRAGGVWVHPDQAERHADEAGGTPAPPEAAPWARAGEPHGWTAAPQICGRGAVILTERRTVVCYLHDDRTYVLSSWR
jgi:hypothetical protein